jgi:DHA2 family multidrug resistance protein
MKQAAVLSYMDVFMVIGLIFLACIPFIMMVKGNKQPTAKIDTSSAH